MKNHSKLILLPLIAALVLALVNCDKEEPLRQATLSTLSVNNITTHTAQSGGKITSDGGWDITARGVVWSTSQNPTLESSLGITDNGHGTGSFTCYLTELTPNTTYYTRAYAINSVGVVYGEQLSFKTKVEMPGTVTDIDGNVYRTVIMGNQEWMAENLKTTKYRNGMPIDYPDTDIMAWRNNTTGAYAWYNNDIAMKDSYGALYKWNAVNNSNGLCPTGWHIPSDVEWDELVNYLVVQGYPNSNVVNGAGNALKSCWQVSSPLGGDCATSDHPRWSQHSTHFGTDEFGFSAQPGGAFSNLGRFYYMGIYGLWWSSTGYSTELANYSWSRILFSYTGNVGRTENIARGYGLSVRCVRDN